MKIAINESPYGFFDVSPKVIQFILDKTSSKIGDIDNEEDVMSCIVLKDNNSLILNLEILHPDFTNITAKELNKFNQSHPLLIEAIENIGLEESSTKICKLKIIDAEEDFTVTDAFDLLIEK